MYLESLEPNDDKKNFKTWSRTNTNNIPQFQYWALVLELELLALQSAIYTFSILEADFTLYVQCLGQLVPWMFSLDHTNYARWLPVHIKDMVQLHQVVPSVHVQFDHGNFVVQKSARVFSTTALDQAYEQMNEHMKGDGGVLGITDNLTAMTMWTTAGAETTQIINEFKISFGKTHKNSTQHHDQGPWTQSKFAKHVKVMVATFEELDNPFMESSKDLIVLDTKEVMGKDAVTNLQTIRAKGKIIVRQLRFLTPGLPSDIRFSSMQALHFQNESPVLELGDVIGIGTAPGFEVHFIIIWFKWF